MSAVLITRKVIVEKFKQYSIQSVAKWQKNFNGELVRRQYNLIHRRTELIVYPTLLSIGYSKGTIEFNITCYDKRWNKSKEKMVQSIVEYYELNNLESVVYRCTKQTHWNNQFSHNFKLYLKFR